MSKATVKSRGETVTVGTMRGRYKLLAKLVGKKAAKRLVRGEATAVVDGVPSVVVRRP